MATPATTTAAMEPATVAASTPAPKTPAVTKPKTAAPPKMYTDDLGPYYIATVNKKDGTTGRVKRRPAPKVEASPEPTPEPAPQKPSAEAAIVQTTEPTTTVAAAAPLAGTPKSEDKTATTQSEKTTPAAPLTGALPADGRHKGAGRRFFRNFGGHITRAAFGPNWDLGDLEDGDEPYYSDDGNSDDDRYESDDERDQNDNNTGTHGNGNGHSSVVGAAASRAFLDATGKPQKKTFATTSLEKDKLVKPVERNEKTSQSSAKAAEVSGAQINEKEVDSSDGNEKASPPARQPQLISKTSLAIRIIISAILIGFPILFIVLGILTAKMKGQPTSSSKADAVNKAITIAVSAWPVVFAAVLAQSLRTYATWRVERGIKLMRLEQLINSNSVAAAVKQPFFLRRIDLVSIGLLILWSFSPLATQAMQRMMYNVPGSDVTTHYNLSYVDTTNENPTLHIDSHEVGFYSTIANLMYEAALLPRDLLAGVDSYNNPLIPILASLTGTPDAANWVDASDVDLTVGYSTIFGIPTAAFPNSTLTGTSNMSITSSYLNFDCAQPTIIPWTKLSAINATLNGTTFRMAASGTLYMAMGAQNASDPGNFSLASAILTTTGDSQQDCNSTNPDYQTQVGCYNSTVAYSSCKFQRTFVESTLECDGRICSVTRMRPMKVIPPDYLPGFNTMVDLADNIVKAEAAYTPNTHTLTERYISDPNTTISVLPAGTISSVGIANLTAAEFTQRLGLLVNTYWQIGFSPTNIAGGVNKANETPGPEYLVNTTAAFTNTSEVFATSDGWLAALFISASVLLIAGIASVLFESWTVGPDVLGFASSIVRQSKYVRIPDEKRGGTAMGGAERARRLGNIEVMMQDVRGDREVGRIALGTVDEHSQRLKAGRLYR